MKRSIIHLLLGISVAGSIMSPADSSAILGLFKKKELERVPSEAERSSQERVASEALRAARELDAQGQTAKALKQYEAIVKSYPLSSAAATAQFRVGEALEASGSLNKAFDAYQKFIQSYRQSELFSTALERQFNIADSALGGRKVKTLGIPRKLAADTQREMFEKIIANGPYTRFAPLSQYNIGEVYRKEGKNNLAIASYQKVVDNYPDNAKAPDAQLAIGKILGSATDRGSQDPTDIEKTREAYEDFETLFPEDERAAEVDKNLKGLEDVDAGKTMKIAKFYEKTGKLKAAAIYYNEVLQYPGTNDYIEARERLAAISAQDPEILKIDPSIAKNQRNAKIPASVDTASRDDYAGPPAPRLAASTLRNKMRAEELEPLIEPDLPEPGGMTRPLVPPKPDSQPEETVLLPPPNVPPAATDDVEKDLKMPEPPLPGGKSAPDSTSDVPELPQPSEPEKTSEAE